MTVVTIGEASGRTFAGQNDTYLNEAAPTTNYDATRTYYFVGAPSSGQRAHSLLIFTGLSNIASGVTVSAVDLQSRMSSAPGANHTIAFHKVLVPWTASQTTWNLRSTGNSWTSGGGFNATDVDLTPIATYNLLTSTDFINVNSNSALNALVEGWINGTIPNYGLMVVRSPDTAYDAIGSAFIQGAATANDGGKPVLTVTYTTTGSTVSTITGTTATEASAVVFTVTMSGTGGLTAAYSWSGTAGAADYTQTLTDGMFTTTGGSGSVIVSGGNIVVPSAVTEFTVTVPTTGDTLDEENETIRLVFGGVTASSGTITDDDAPPTITGTASSTVTAGDPVVITYSPGLSGQTRTYTLALTDGTATGGTDYDNTIVTGDFAVTAGTGSVSISGSTVTVDPGVTEFTLTITTT